MASMGTGPKPPQKNQVDVLAEHLVVRRVITDGLGRRAVEYNRGCPHFPSNRLRQCSYVYHAPGHAYASAPVSFAEAVVLWRLRRAKILHDSRGLAVVKVEAGDELATAIDTQVLEATSERHDKVLHEMDESRQCFVLRRDEVDHL